MFGTRTLGALVVVCLLPLAGAAQIRVTSMYGPVEIQPVDQPRLAWIESRTEDELPTLGIGDRIVTGKNGQVTLELPDGSYVVVAENSTLDIERFWGAEIRDLINVLMGRVRFHIQKLGGRPNPYRIHTPTALIAVRGTDFEVLTDPEIGATEVRTFEGRVTVESPGIEREVILDAGRKTLVRAGQPPLTPVGLEDDFGASRVFEVVRVDDEAPAEALTVPGTDGLPMGVDNDRRRNGADPLASGPASGSGTGRTLRLKLSFPQP